ncbi:33 kDa ribonucleoprotein [Tripterygium wilfordii]|uniref:33 kDa ribonucleoprotein n=1 Tax=Tripterygium wilfordii TaxID=458696 RepID=A0A7J7CTJ9_TRIWF|nr:33 kDa ribonucleoprotein, chloroplastic-like [Tripterygium wilfordii]KAF5737400.1 33 kDa ribonucleoprotein [Tripterygium wilfordii]
MAASSSSLFYTNHSNFCFSHSLFPLLPTHFPSKPQSLKPLTLAPQVLAPVLFALPHFRSTFAAAAVAFESSEETQHDNNVTSEEEEDPETETQGFEEEQGGGGEIEQNESESNGEGRLYVGNLPYSMTTSQLVEVFREAGRVVSAEIIYDRVTDRSRGFGFVTMGSIEEAKEAIRMFTGSQIGGRTVKVNFSEVPKGGEREVMGPRIRKSNRDFVDSPHKIYAGNLGWRLTSEDLRDAFANQPGVLSAKVVYERDSGRSRGYGFVSFESAEHVKSVLNAMNGVEVEGRPLRLNLATVRPPLTPPAPEENVETDMDSSELLSTISN